MNSIKMNRNYSFICLLLHLIRHVQRTSTEHDEIFRILKQFPQFMALDHRLDVLRQLVEVAHLELCEEVKQPGFFDHQLSYFFS